MEAWERIFAHLADSLADYEPRHGQRELAAAVARVLAEGGHLVAEAGTGTGKSFAYLVPLLAYAAERGEKVAVSTGTIALQEQIVLKDLPFLRQLLPRPPEAVLVKGRGHYLCRWRLAREQTSLGLFPEEGWPELLAWAEETATGDAAEVEGVIPPALWARVAADGTCLRPYCPYQGECFFLAARERVGRAQILVANHHLYLSDLRVRLASGGEAAVLPEHRTAVFDEAHHLPAVAADALGVEVGFPRFASLIRSLRLLGLPAPPAGLLQGLEEAAAAFFAALDPPAGEDEEAWSLSDRPLPPSPDLRRRLRELCRHLEGLRAQEQLSIPVAEALAKLAQEAEQLAADLEFVLRGEEGFVCWAQAVTEGRRRRVILRATPLEVGGLLRRHLFDRLRATVLTSATISVGGDFTFFRRETGVPPTAELSLPSPFSFANQCLLYTPTDLPEPNDPEFYQAAAGRIEQLLHLSRGRALVLFTSYRGLYLVYEYLAARVPFPLYRQGDLSRYRLLTAFREQVESVLLATASFWEGVDVPGEALSCLIIDRLPFAVPNHPVTRARLAAIRAAGGNDFLDFSLPQAVLKLKQGFGRLIRSRRDRGVVAVLDRRLVRRAYGRRFLAALPPCPRTESLTEVARFFAGKSQMGYN